MTGIEVSGQDQPFGQNAYSRTSQQTYRDVAGVFQDTWTIGNNKVNEFRFQYARRGLSYFYNTEIPGRIRSGRQHPRLRLLRARAVLLHSAHRAALPVHRQFLLDRRPPQHEIRRRLQLPAAECHLHRELRRRLRLRHVRRVEPRIRQSESRRLFRTFPISPPCRPTARAYPEISFRASAVPATLSPTSPSELFWQDSWRVTPHVTLNYGVRYDIEIPPKFKPPQGLALPAYNLLGLQKGIQTDKNNIQPRIGLAWDPKGDGKTVVRASYGMFYDHPLLGLYFLGDASDGSSSGQLAFAGTSTCSGAGNPGNLNAITIFQGLPINQPSAAPILARPR